MAYRRQRSSFLVGFLHYLLAELRGVLVTMAVVAVGIFLVASLFVGMYQITWSIIWAVLFS